MSGVSDQRSRTMRAVRSENTTPEKAVRSLTHRLGYRFRLHGRNLPGAPDLVFPGKKAVIFVHGCFWHGHDCKRGARIPKTNSEYWIKKISGNQERDLRNIILLEEKGWRVLVIWECEIKDLESLSARLSGFLGQE